MTTRRGFLGWLASLPLAGVSASTSSQAIAQRTIPSTGEQIPCVGLGTWQTFSLTARDSSLAVLRRFVDMGGRVIDTSPMYGQAEAAIGQLAQEAGVLDRLFVASKVWTRGESAGKAQIARSFDLLKRDPIDLMQIHNLVDWRTQLATLMAMKREGRVRHVGITHYVDSAHDDLIAVLREHPLDFVQVNYNIVSRHAERELLPVATDRGTAVLVNRPYQEGALFRSVRGQPVPDFAAECGCASWGQVFLKFILSHPAVTAVIPATSKVHHLEDNMGAGLGPLPDSALRERMAEHVRSL